MGYDMSWHKVPEEITALYNELYVQEPTPEGDERMELVDRYFAARDAAGVYFRLNIGGMAVFGDYMSIMGMTFYVRRADVGDFPSVVDYGFVGYSDEYYAAERDESHPLHAQYKAHRDAVYAHVSRTFGGPGIPVHKVCGTNDGWHVTPGEIRLALETYQHCGGDDAAREIVAENDWDYWKKWLAFMESAAKDGEGFRVW